MKRVFETAVILLGTIGWWGFVYPELYLTEEICQEEVLDTLDTGIMVEDFSGCCGKVCIKSKVIEYLYQEKEKGFES